MSLNRRRVAIIGAGFGGLYAAKELARHPDRVAVTVIDRHNYHLFQPLLYQVAVGLLSPEDIAYPIRSIFSANKNVTVLKGLVRSVNTSRQTVQLSDFSIPYDYLIVGCGVQPDYFGHDDWAKFAPGLKTIRDALYMRMRILNTFELAERKSDPGLLNFVIIGGGPTGVELSGALAELSKIVLKNDFRNIRAEQASIYLIEAGAHILPGFPAKLIAAAEHALKRLGVTIMTNMRVTNITGNSAEIESSTGKKIIQSQTVLWAAGVKAAAIPDFFLHAHGFEFDNKMRIKINADLSFGEHGNIFIVGDMAHVRQEDGRPLPGVAPVAMQQGKYAAQRILADIKGKTLPDFNYRNKGNLAVIGRNAAVANLGFLQIKGFAAWLVWVFVHIGYLIGYQKKALVMLNWAWNYIRKKSSARIVFGCEDRDVGHPLPKCPE